jgi:hypothetical protein
MSKRAAAADLTADQRALLTEWVRAHGTPQQMVKCCRRVSQADQGLSDVEIAPDPEFNRHTCRLWRKRFPSEGAASLWQIAEGRGRKPQPGLTERTVEAIPTDNIGSRSLAIRSFCRRSGWK